VRDQRCAETTAEAEHDGLARVHHEVGMQIAHGERDADLAAGLQDALAELAGMPWYRAGSRSRMVTGYTESNSGASGRRPSPLLRHAHDASPHVSDL
jgi:hypothetical protein